jgi:PAS domain S-box-containing protein
MPEQTSPRFVSNLIRLSEAFCVLVFLIGFLASIGWQFNITFFKSILPNYPVIAPNTAFALILASIALLCLQENQNKKWYFYLGYFLAGTIAIIGAVTLFEYLANINFGIDNIFYKNALDQYGLPVRMSPQSAVNFLIISLSLFLINKETRNKNLPSQFLVIVVGFISFLSLFGFIQNVPSFYTISPYKGMAAHTAVAFALLFAAIFISRPDKGLMKTFGSRGVGGYILRRIFFSLVFLSIAGILIVVGRQNGIYGTTPESIFHILLISAVFIYLIFISFESLSKIEFVEESKKTLEHQTEELKNFKLAFENASDHIIITNPDGAIIYANKASKETTGFYPEELIGKTPRSWGRQMPPEFYQKLWQTIKTKKTIFTEEIANVRKNGEKYIAELHISPILDSENNIKFFVGIERDITKAKEIDKAKTEFVSLVSHQLRTPLSAIKWQLDVILGEKGGKLSDKQKEQLKDINDANNRMIGLINSLLNISRIELGTLAVELEAARLDSIAEDVLEELASQIQTKKITIRKNYDKTLPPLEIDAKLTRIIFQNLLSNALKYTPGEGLVNLEIKKQGSDAIIKVSDNGYGIPEAQKTKIFTKLFRADNAKETDPYGTGLGLYIVKSILERTGGKVWFESKENEGTTFFATIPLKGMNA